MIYLVVILAATCFLLLYLLTLKPRTIVETREIEVIREVSTVVDTKSKSVNREWQSADIETRDRLLSAMERKAMQVAIESSTTTVHLDSPDQKGRIIGREGRNLRAFEQITGVEVLIDESENLVTLSSFDPFRREVAKRTLESLLQDGKIQPSRIEETHAHRLAEVESSLADYGTKAIKALSLEVKEPILSALGRLHFRTSFAQNVLDHSIETAHIAAQVASEFDLEVTVAKRAALFHDIGKALDEEGPHALTGMAFLKKCGEQEPILNAVGAHHQDIAPDSPYASIVIIADTLSASRPGARKESHDNYIQRLQTIEAIANSQPGVEKSFAIQAGRELRVLVQPDKISDEGLTALVQAIGSAIKENSDHRGQIQITAIRESRFSETFRL